MSLQLGDCVLPSAQEQLFRKVQLPHFSLEKGKNGIITPVHFRASEHRGSLRDVCLFPLSSKAVVCGAAAQVGAWLCQESWVWLLPCASPVPALCHAAIREGTAREQLILLLQLAVLTGHPETLCFFLGVLMNIFIECGRRGCCDLSAMALHEGPTALQSPF